MLLWLVAPAWAKAAPTTAPTSAPSSRAPTTAPAIAGASTTAPALASAGTTQPAAYPTPAELFAQLKQIREKEASQPKVALFDLRQPIVEQPPLFSLFGDDDSTTLHELLDRIKQAKTDKSIRALLVLCGSDLNLAQAQEIRDALKSVRSSGKRVFVYADSYDTVSYTLASSATDICMLDGGEVMIPGVGIETMFFRGALDKLGVEADFVQIGQYKGAEEPFTRTGPSDELRGELNKLTQSMYDQIIQGIAAARDLSDEDVKGIVDDAMIVGQAAKDRGLVDHLIDQDGLRDLLKDELGSDVNLVEDYGQPERDQIDLSSPFAFLSLLSHRSETSDRTAVALIYAQGVITDGEGDNGLFSNVGIATEPMRRALRMAARDDSVKAVVLRIDSPGGSALASEAIWQAARRVAAKKPLIVSVGSEAASGGYYLACSGDFIFADPSAIIGSIGVVGGKFVYHDLLTKLGLSTEVFAKGRNAGLFSSNEPWSDRQKRMVHNWMQQTYDQFTQRVLSTRGKHIRNIDDVARGRIFLATQARDLGMVDELGGTEAAIAMAAKRAGLKEGQYEVRILPPQRTLADLLSGMGQGDALSPVRPPLSWRSSAASLSADSLLQQLPKQMRTALLTQLQAARLLEERPVILMAPFTATVQ
jgi:protease-4